MKATKSLVDKPRKESKQHGGAQAESRLIKKYADEWCKDNGYPVQKRYYVYRGKAC